MTKLFIFEGVDGTGKSFLATNVYEYLRRNVVSFVKASYPSDNVKQEINTFIKLNKKSDKSITNSLIADFKSVEGLNLYNHVVFDRYVYSLAYQVSQGLMTLEEFLTEATSILNSFKNPKVYVFYLSCDPAVSKERAKNKNNPEDLLDNQEIAFYENVNKSYMDIFHALERSQNLNTYYQGTKIFICK